MPSEIVGFCGSLFYMTIILYLLEIKTSLVVFSALKLFFYYSYVLYLRLVGYRASYKLFFSKMTKLKNSQDQACHFI